MSGRAVGLLALLSLTCAISTACHSESGDRARRSAEVRRELAELSRRSAERRATEPQIRDGGATAARGAPSDGTATPSPRASDRATTSPAPSSASAPFIADEPVRVAGPGPATATAHGVVMNTVDGELVTARLGPPATAPGPSRTNLRPMKGGEGPFAFVRGPSLGPSGSYAYWVSHGSLARRRVGTSGETGALEVLAHDALDGTRVAVPLGAPSTAVPKLPETVAYVTRPVKEGDPFLAKLWVEGSAPLLLTAEGNGSHSVSLVRTPDGLLALSVQARMAITPVHARRVHFDGARPVLGDDLVVWVGGGVQPLTEMATLPDGAEGLFGFIPHERSIKEFGIAELAIGMHPTMDTKTSWLIYPNGIEPAPVATGHVCGEPVLLYAAPETATPGAEEELVVRVLGDESGTRFQRVATAKAFYFVSLSSTDRGALAVFVEPGGTFAATLRCKTKRK